MPFFLKVANMGDGREGDSPSTVAMNQYKKKRNIIENKYKDGLGNITSPKYYDELTDLIYTTIENPSLKDNNINSLVDDLQDISVQKNNFDLVDTIKTGDKGKTIVDQDLNDVWQEIWSNKTALNSGNFDGMLMTMEEYIREEKTKLESELENLKAITADEDMINGVQEVIDYYDEQESLYRDAQINPQRYRFDVNSNDIGEITDIKLNNLNTANGGFVNTGKTTNKDTGIKIFSRPNQALTKDDEQVSLLGGSAFRRYDDKSDFESGDEDFDFTTWKTQDPRNSRTGDILVTPTGNVLMKNEDGSYEKSRVYNAFTKNRTIDTVLGIPVQASNQYRITSDMAEKIERTQNVNDVVKEQMKFGTSADKVRSNIESYIKLSNPQGDIGSSFQTSESTPMFAQYQKKEKSPSTQKSGFIETVKGIFKGEYNTPSKYFKGVLGEDNIVSNTLSGKYASPSNIKKAVDYVRARNNN